MTAFVNGGAFLSPAAPVFDTRKIAGMTDLLIGNGDLGKALSMTLGQGAVANKFPNQQMTRGAK